MNIEKILTISAVAYNVEKHLNQALPSLIGADFMDDIKVLIQNDGSTDNTERIAAEYPYTTL